MNSGQFLAFPGAGEAASTGGDRRRSNWLRPRGFPLFRESRDAATDWLRPRGFRLLASLRRPFRAVPNLDALATPDLALAIESPNGTLRDNAKCQHIKGLFTCPQST